MLVIIIKSFDLVINHSLVHRSVHYFISESIIQPLLLHVSAYFILLIRNRPASILKVNYLSRIFKVQTTNVGPA
jgi:hypothetical protein